MKEWFYVKNDLNAREDVKDIIMRPIWQRFGLRKPKVEFDEAAEECQKAFGIVCSFIARTVFSLISHLDFIHKLAISCFARFRCYGYNAFLDRKSVV